MFGPQGRARRETKQLDRWAVRRLVRRVWVVFFLFLSLSCVPHTTQESRPSSSRERLDPQSIINLSAKVMMNLGVPRCDGGLRPGKRPSPLAIY